LRERKVFKFLRNKIGIIGYGNMGSAIGERLKTKYQIYTFDKDKNKTKKLSGIYVTDNILDLLRKVETVILAVKPQDFDSILNEIKNNIEGKLIISIAAGIPTSYLEKILGEVRVVRVMPNLPARVGKGMSCLCKGRFASEEDLDLAEEVFKRVGETLLINENMMDAATAVSGSGPGFFCDLVEGESPDEIKDFSEQYFIPSLNASARSIAFTPIQAKILAEATGGGIVEYLISQHLTPSEVKKQVASPGGTTEAGLEVLLHDIKNLEKAVKAAAKRAEELSKKE